MGKISFVFFLLLTCHAQAQQIDTLKYCIREKGVGVGGYDPVSYFNSDKPLPGNDRITFEYDGVEYRFVSDENRKAFAANPENFLPQFGGWCSMTMVMGRATAPTYTNFLISEGKFYLFERTLSVNGKELWLKNRVENERIAAENYKWYKKTGKIR